MRRATKSRSGFGPDAVSFRKYGSPISFAGTPAEEFNQRNLTSDQIYGFLFCGKFALQAETLFEKAVALWKAAEKEEAPNIIVSLGDGVLQPYVRSKKQLQVGIVDADSIAFVPSSDGTGFGTLLHKLNSVVRHGRTVDAAEYQKYFLKAAATFGVSLIADL